MSQKQEFVMETFPFAVSVNGHLVKLTQPVSGEDDAVIYLDSSQVSLAISMLRKAENFISGEYDE